MPLYEYTCSECDETVEVLRSFDAYKVPPGIDDDKLPDSECKHKWKRIISGGVKVIRGATWGPGKGHW